MSLIVVGSANMDLVVHTPRFPAPGETILGSTFETQPGGKGANQAVAAAMLGGDVWFVGSVGNDSFGQTLREQLAGKGVQTKFLATDHLAASGVAAIAVDGSGQNTIIVAPGANMSVTAEQGLSALERLPGSTLLVQLEIPVPVVCALLDSNKAATCILNPAPAAELPADTYSRIDIITPNETEASLLTGVSVQDLDSAQRAAAVFLDRGVMEVVITLGSQGALYCASTVERYYPAHSVKAIDTVAAGDAFSGALAHFVSIGVDTGDAISLASAVAALSTTKRGAQQSMPTLEEVGRFVPDLVRSVKLAK